MRGRQALVHSIVVVRLASITRFQSASVTVSALPGAPMPTIFRADAKGQEYSVNSAARGTTIIVSTRSERWVLRYGDEYVCVTAVEGTGQ